MVLFDEADSCGEGSSSTLMEFFPNKSKGKMVELPSQRIEEEVGVSHIQIRGEIRNFGEEEIEDVVEAIKRSRRDLRSGIEVGSSSHDFESSLEDVKVGQRGEIRGNFDLLFRLEQQ